MVDAADFMAIERTYPHVDMAERAAHAASVMGRALRGEIGRPVVAWVPLPILWSAKKMIDAEQPFQSIVGMLEDLVPSTPGLMPSAAENIGRSGQVPGQPRLLSVSVGVGYQACDSPTNGAAVLVCAAEQDRRLAQATAEELAVSIWRRRAEWIFSEPSPAEALAAGGTMHHAVWTRPP